ncbi:uncharacterized protein STEHIDRAFT_161530 [Stereum hirsutum FP-91666 SS1]|uniref:uncharacterized protein n=1 Tax=Stereum hirsutum (strain FP-91666) TaxID=721885 RepID=UPI000444A7A7|nr:uncharacterized protein STEHIDRAFT_161530 [Stereum hirsutum FP-91666 SS1]EIM82190.1 hypothetical protein STEHIDRAFT_161530 [Stereum hirsutum FP-91666 SS1]
MFNNALQDAVQQSLNSHLALSDYTERLHFVVVNTPTIPIISVNSHTTHPLSSSSKWSPSSHSLVNVLRYPPLQVPTRPEDDMKNVSLSVWSDLGLL